MKLFRSYLLIILLFVSVTGRANQTNDTLHIGNSLLWKITGKGLTQPSYIYGTMHSKRNEVFHFADSVWCSFESCNAFAMEVLLDELSYQDLYKGMMMDSGYTLKSLLGNHYYEMLDSICQQNIGMSAYFMNQFKPLFAITALVKNDVKLQSEHADFLDLFFLKNAIMDSKKVSGLETVQDQLKVFDVLSYRQQADLLIKSLDEGANGNDEFENIIHSYASNNLDQLMELENDFDIPSEFYNQLIGIRNKNMANKIDSLVSSTNTFVAIGAGHLAGESGVVNLLREKGYTVTPVLPTFNIYETGNQFHFISTASAFSIDFPSAPMFSAFECDTLEKGISHHIRKYYCNDSSSFVSYSVSVSNHHENRNFVNASSVKQVSLKHFESDVKMINEKLSLQHMTGRNKDGSYFIANLYTDEGRTILLKVDSRFRKEKDEEVQRFFDSFQYW